MMKTHATRFCEKEQSANDAERLKTFALCNFEHAVRFNGSPMAASEGSRTVRSTPTSHVTESNSHHYLSLHTRVAKMYNTKSQDWNSVSSLPEGVNTKNWPIRPTFHFLSLCKHRRRRVTTNDVTG